MKVQSLLLLALLGAVSATQAGAVDPAIKKSVFVNYDDTHFFHSRAKFAREVDETEIRSLVRKYRGTDVTDLLFCIGGRIADVPNKAKESWCDKYHQTKENGRAVCYTNSYAPRLAHELYEVRKIDPYAIWCDEAHACGLHPWLSFRLNDCHQNGAPTSHLHPNFFHEHPEYRRIRHREPKGYFDRCFDFEIEAVRARELSFIREMLERYDADGVELDWQREIYCFAPGRENADTVTSFTRAVRALADAAAKRRGHPVKVMARVPADPETALRFGFDAVAWADEKLVDVLVPCPRWDVTDNEIPVDLWKRLLRKTGVVLAPGVEIRMHNYGAPEFHATPRQLVGAASSFYSQGADGLYFYNYFDDVDWGRAADGSHRCYWEAFNQPVETKAVCWGNQLKWLKMIGTPAKLFAAPRDHMLTFRDIVPLWEDVTSPLPATVGARGVRFFRLATGPVPAGARLRLRLGVKDGVPPKRVFVNSRPARYVANEKCVPAFTPYPLCVYAVDAYPESAAVVEVLPDAAVTITHLDFQVDVTE